MRRSSPILKGAWLAAGFVAAAPASAQILGGGLPSSLPPSIGQPLGGITDRAVGSVVDNSSQALSSARLPDLRRLRLERLLRANPRELERDEQGFPIVRAEILAVSPSAESLAAARAAGFTVVRREQLEPLDIVLVTLAPPSGRSTARALRRLQKLDPRGEYDLNHIYIDAGSGLPDSPVPDGVLHSGSGQAAAARARVGLIDTGVDARHPALAGSGVEQRGFAPGGVVPRPHGTAVASILAGRSGSFRGAAPGATVVVADVYGVAPTGGSAKLVARGLAWMAEQRTSVINVSLVGPPNRTLEAVVGALVRRGQVVVAAVGNDGPAAPPLYPAAYPGVVAVTGVDSRRRALPEAGRGPHVLFAAPGSDMFAARPGDGFAAVRGTSFAAPIVAGRLAHELVAGAPAKAAVQRIASGAIDLGARGRDPVYGFGLVGAEVRTSLSALRGTQR